MFCYVETAKQLRSNFALRSIVIVSQYFLDAKQLMVEPVPSLVVSTPSTPPLRVREMAHTHSGGLAKKMAHTHSGGLAKNIGADRWRGS